MSQFPESQQSPPTAPQQPVHPYPPAQLPPEVKAEQAKPKESRRFRLRALIGASTVALLLGMGLGNGISSTSTTPAAPGAPRPTVTVTEPVGEPDFGNEPTSEPTINYTARKADWTLKVKEKDKTCYGSGLGCDVTVAISPRFEGDRSALPEQGVIEITYKVTGDKNGPQTGTITAYVADETSTVEEHWLDIPSSSSKIKAAITQVEYNEYG